MRAFHYIDVAFGFVPLLMAWRRRTLFDRPLWLFLWHLMLTSLNEVVTLILGKLWIPNAPANLLYHVADTLVLLLMFREVLADRPYARFIPWLFAAYLAAFIVTKFNIEPMTGPDQYSYTAVGVVLLGLSVLVLLRCLGNDRGDPVSNPWTWISIGFTASFALYAAMSSVLKWYVTLSYDEGVRLYSFIWIGNIVVNGIFAFGLLRVREKWTTGG